MNARATLLLTAVMAMVATPKATAEAPPAYQWRPLAPLAAVPWQAAPAPAAAADATWVWLPAATFVRVLTALPAADVRLVRLEVGEGGHATQPWSAVPVDGGLGIWHMAGTGAYLGIWAPGHPGAAFEVERAVRRQPAWAASQLRLGLWAWLFRGQPLEPRLLAGSELAAYEPLAAWAVAHDASLAGRAALWDFFVTRSLGVMASGLDTERAALTAAPCHVAADGALALRITGPAWVRVAAQQPVATWQPWQLSVTSPSSTGDVLRARVAGLGSLAVVGADVEGNEIADAEDATDPNAALGGASRALVTQLWLPAATTELSLHTTNAQGATAACFAVTATRPRKAWFTPALRAYPVAAPRPAAAPGAVDDTTPSPATSTIIAEAMGAGSRLLAPDDARLAAMWTALFALTRDPTPQGRDAAVGMAMLIAEQARTLEAHEAARLTRITAKHPWAAAAAALVAKRVAAPALEAVGVGAVAGRTVPYVDVMGMALASALRTPADRHAREALLTAWRQGRWGAFPEFVLPPLASAPRVTVLGGTRAPTTESDAWHAFAPAASLTIVADAPALPPHRANVALMARWRIIIRSRRAVVTVRLAGQAHTLTVAHGVAQGEWFLPLGRHQVAWDGEAGDVLYSSLPGVSLAPTTSPATRTTAQVFVRLRCDETWTLAAPSLPFVRVSATAIATATVASTSAAMPTVRLTPDRGEGSTLAFAPAGATTVTTQGREMRQPVTATATLPADATSFTVTCDGADEAWLSLQQRADGARGEVDELASALAMQGLPEATPTALAGLTTDLRTRRDAATLAKRAYVWWALGHGELARFDALSAQARATPAEQRELARMLAPLQDEPRLVEVPATHQAWAQAAQLVTLPEARPAACDDEVFGGTPAACLQAMLTRYAEADAWAAAIGAAKAYLALTKQGEASAAQSLAMYAATTGALQRGFHPALQWARTASARGTTRKLIMAVDDSAGSVPVVKPAAPPDLETAMGARTLALDAPWTSAQGLIVLDHGAGAALRLTGGKTVRLGLWCQPLRDDAAAQPGCQVTWRLNQRPVQALAVPPREATWQEVTLPAGPAALAFDLVAPMRDRLMGIVVFEGAEPIVGQALQKAFRVVPGQPVSVRVAGPTVVTVERVAGPGVNAANVTATLGGQAVTLAADLPAELAVVDDAPQTLAVVADAEALVMVRVRVASRTVRALPPLLDATPVAPRQAFALPTPVLPTAVPAPRQGRVPTVTARLRVGIERQDESGTFGGGNGGEATELGATTVSASVVEARLGVRRRLTHGAGQTWLAVDTTARRFNGLPTSPGAELTLNTRWWGRLGVQAAGRYTYATTGLPDGVIILGQAPRAHVGRLAAEAYGQWAGRRWFLRPSILYRDNWASDAAVVDADATVWNNYVAQMPRWYEGALLGQWSPALDARVALSPRVRLDQVAHLETLSARVRLSGLLAQRRWGGVYLALAWQPQYWVKNAEAQILRLDPYFAHQSTVAIDFLRHWRRQGWFKLGFRASVEYVKGRRDVAGWLQFEFTKSQRRTLDDMLPSEQDFDQLTNGRVWADETY